MQPSFRRFRLNPDVKVAHTGPHRRDGGSRGMYCSAYDHGSLMVGIGLTSTTEYPEITIVNHEL